MGAEVGAEVGADVGAEVGPEVGAEVGADVGADVGAEVGADVGQTPQSSGQFQQDSFSSHTPFPQYTPGMISQQIPLHTSAFLSIILPL